MAKTYQWKEETGYISLAGGTSTDVMTFKNITDYFEANPLSLNYNLPRHYGGRCVITGDTTTYSSTAGDKLKITLNGVVYDDIAISGTSTIAAVVIKINNIITSSVRGYYPVASVNGSGNIVLTACTIDETGSITVADGTTTVNPCVAKLFSSAPIRTNSTTSTPYELTENNASNWLGFAGMATPTDDTTNFTKGLASVTAAVSSVPTGTTITRVNSQSDVVLIYMADTSAFTVGDEVIITGTTNFNGVMSRITYISANVYVYIQTPRDCPYPINETGITGATLVKPLTLAWNTADTVAYTTAPYTSVSIADKIKLSAKTDGAGTVKIIGIVVRNNTTAGANVTPFGATYKADWTLTSSWADFEIDMRTQMKNFSFIPHDGNGRTQWFAFSKFYVMFDGLAVGDNVWIDGVRFTCTDRNPKRTENNNFIFPTGFYIPSGCWFKDYGFNVRFDALDSSGVYPSGNGGMTVVSANLGEVQFGDYSGTSVYKEGGVFIFNAFGMEDNATSIIFTKVQCQGITFTGFKDQYGFAQISSPGTNNYRNCNWINSLNFFQTEANSTFENCAWMGGRYFMAFPLAGTVINGFTVYGLAIYPFYMRGQYATPINVKGIKVIDNTASKIICNADSYNSSAVLGQGARFINLDLSECASTCRFGVQNYAIHTPYTCTNYVAFSFNLTVTDDAGTAISGATVKMTDKDGNQLFSVTTDVSGVITEQTIDTMKVYFANTGNGSKYFYFATPTVDWTYYFPFTLTVSKSGYETYTDTLLKDGYSRTNEICKKGYAGKIALKAAKPILMDLNSDIFLNLDKENEGKVVCLAKL